MYAYNVIQWLFFFYFYCLAGWCFESAYVSVKKRKFVNRGFMRGPFLPLYGTGAVMMLVVSYPVRGNLFLVYVAGCIGATVLEYVTGVAMEALFKVRYWDYSNQKFNFQGHICLSSSLAWGLLTILMTQVIHKPVEWLALSIPYTLLTVLTIALTFLLATDFALSFRTALDLRNVMLGVERAKAELARMQKRLDVIIALADNEKETKRQEREYRTEELLSGIEERLAGVKKRVQEGSSEYLDSVRDEIAELRAGFEFEKNHRLSVGAMKDFYRRHMILDNPNMASDKFKAALEELKKAAENHRKGQE